MALFNGALNNFKDGAASLARYSWVLYVFVGIAVVIFAAFMIKRVRESKKQWTHILKIRRSMDKVEPGKKLRLFPGTDIIKMRRSAIKKKFFLLERPLLGKFIFPELSAYSDKNEYSIVLGTDNRIYINEGEYFDVNDKSTKISTKFASIDNLYEEVDDKYGKVYEQPKKLELKEIMKMALLGIALIFLLVVTIKGIDQWGENHRIDAEMKQVELEYIKTMNDVAIRMEENQNLNLLLIPKLKELYGTNNLQPLIEEARNETIS